MGAYLYSRGGGEKPVGPQAALYGGLPSSRGIVALVSDLDELRLRMRDFTTERDWAQFHDPKSLVLALVGEVGELAELFQWLPSADAERLAKAEPLASRVGEEISDVLLYLVRLADVLDVDLTIAANSKLTSAAGRFPAADVSGVAPTKE